MPHPSRFTVPLLVLASCRGAQAMPLPMPALVVVQAATETPTATAPPTATESPSPAPTLTPTPTFMPPLPPRTGTPTATAPPVTYAGTTDAAEELVIELTNAHRLAAGLPALAANASLMAIARGRAVDMVARGYFGHTDPITGEHLARQRAAEAGFTGRVGENIYWSGRPLATLPSEAVTWFMGDAVHAANILKPEFASIGAGIAPGANDTWILSQMFASP